MKVLIAGASGFLGRALAAHLEAAGDTPIALRRGPTTSGIHSWHPERGTLDPAALDGIDAVVNLAGESIAGGWWTPARRRRIMASRVEGTRLLAEALAAHRQSARVLVCASAVGIYGNRHDELLIESSRPGEGFLAEVGQAWEAAARPAALAGIRVVQPRFGIVLDRSGGMLRTILPVFRLGLGGRLGPGTQWMSWVALADAVAVLDFALRAPALQGAVNAVSPHPVRNRDFTRALGGVLRRPTIFGVPAAVLRVGLGRMADDLLLASQRCVPDRLTALGFRFRHPDLEPALRMTLGASS